MSYVNGTTHYNLPQTVGTDKRDWSDTNKAFADLDAAVYSANNDLTGVTDRVTALESDNTVNKENITKNASDITTIEGRVTAVEHVANDANNAVADVRNDAEDMITAYNEKSAQSTRDYEAGQFFIYNDVLYKATQKISAGNTIIPNTNCEATNVTTALSEQVRILNVTSVSDLITKLASFLETVYNGDKKKLTSVKLLFENTGSVKNTKLTLKYFVPDSNYFSFTGERIVGTSVGNLLEQKIALINDDKTQTLNLLNVVYNEKTDPKSITFQIRSIESVNNDTVYVIY